jgi:hypothetical protein
MSQPAPRVPQPASELHVRVPQPADAVGRSLRGAFKVAAVPDDMQAVLDALALVPRL